MLSFWGERIPPLLQNYVVCVPLPSALCPLPSALSVAYVSRSGGMSNELNNIIARNTNGVYEGVAIGGDRLVKNFVEFLIFLSIAFCHTGCQ